MFAQQAEEKGLELATQLSPPNLPLVVRGDPFRLRQVLANLINNAIKFTRQGEVVVRAHMLGEADADSRVYLSVEDTGVGIVPEALGKVFEHFTQADGSTTRQFGGTGLGLAISRRLVELMGGSIGVQSEVGRGSKFWVDLILAKGAGTAEAHALVPQLEDRRVLVVDDNQTNLEILRLQLGGWRMRVTCAESGAQALEAMGDAVASDAPFDLVLLDMHMPHMDGLQLARLIQANPRLARARLVMLTSTYAAGDAQEREQAGILRCVNKPVRQSELHEVITWALMSGQAETSVNSAVVRAAVPEPPPRPPAALHGRVLLAEDNPVNQEVAKAMLGNLGLAVEVANNGEDALALLAGQHFDVILMDCHMPVMDGYQATAALRQREAAGGGHLPVVALTANAMEGDRDQCLAAGMDDYLAKPYTRAQLEEVLRRWLPAPASVTPLPKTPADAAPAPVDGGAVIDRQVLDKYRELDPSGGLGLARQIMRVYLESSGESVGQVERAIAASDAETLRRAAHTLKSSTANVGGMALSDIFRELERLGKEARLDEAGPLFDTARREYERVRSEIHTLLREAA
jgi:CheY-like chemotaxis protein/HPt (histidine-containing phosphotransfer) domain-containing protein